MKSVIVTLRICGFSLRGLAVSLGLIEAHEACKAEEGPNSAEVACAPQASASDHRRLPHPLIGLQLLQAV